jgi:hypothetical protein
VEGAVHYIQRHFGLAHSNFGSEQEFDETPDLLAGQLSEERSPLFSYRQSDGVALDNWRLFLLCRAGTTGGRRVYTSPGKVYLGISLCQTSRALQEFDGTRMFGCFLEDHRFCPGPPQRRLAPGGGPSFQIAQVERAHRALRLAESPRHLPRRRTLARLAHNLLEPLAPARSSPP